MLANWGQRVTAIDVLDHTQVERIYCLSVSLCSRGARMSAQFAQLYPRRFAATVRTLKRSFDATNRFLVHPAGDPFPPQLELEGAFELVLALGVPLCISSHSAIPIIHVFLPIITQISFLLMFGYFSQIICLVSMIL